MKLGQSLYREGPGLDQYRPDQRTPIPNFFMAGSYTYQVRFNTTRRHWKGCGCGGDSLRTKEEAVVFATSCFLWGRLGGAGWKAEGEAGRCLWSRAGGVFWCEKLVGRYMPNIVETFRVPHHATRSLLLPTPVIRDVVNTAVRSGTFLRNYFEGSRKKEFERSWERVALPYLWC